MNVNRLRMISDKGLTIFKKFLQYLWYNKSSIIVRWALWAETTTAKASENTLPHPTNGTQPRRKCSAKNRIEFYTKILSQSALLCSCINTRFTNIQKPSRCTSFIAKLGVSTFVSLTIINTLINMTLAILGFYKNGFFKVPKIVLGEDLLYQYFGYYMLF